MAGSSFGTLFRLQHWGESHGAGIGVVVDGCPAGLSLSSSDIQVFLKPQETGADLLLHHEERSRRGRNPLRRL